ncbi:hypothetical protein ACJJTC_013876 [Scirpophaga incertulas]
MRFLHFNTIRTNRQIFVGSSKSISLGTGKKPWATAQEDHSTYLVWITTDNSHARRHPTQGDPHLGYNSGIIMSDSSPIAQSDDEAIIRPRTVGATQIQQLGSKSSDMTRWTNDSLTNLAVRPLALMG